MSLFFLKRIKKNLIIGFSKRAGRNFFGRKTIFTQSGGYFNYLRSIDFKRVLNLSGLLLSIEKDVKRTAFIGLVAFSNGFFSYILLPYMKELKIFETFNGFNNKLTERSSLFLYKIPTGNFIHNIAVNYGKNASIARAAGIGLFVFSKDEHYTYLKSRSGWLLKISNFGVAVLGFVSNDEHHITRIPNAGKNRKLGVRPKVRGVAMNPCDHPHGGGEGTGSPPRAHKTPWGKLAKSATKIKKKFLLKRRAFKIFKKRKRK